MGYCPKCKSRLYPGDADYMEATGMCSYCVTYAPQSQKKELLEKVQDHKLAVIRRAAKKAAQQRRN